MSEQPSYTALPGRRCGSGSASVLRYLLRDLAQKPAQAPIVPIVPRAPGQLVGA